MSILSVPLKVVLAWFADAQTGLTPPDGWEICDGRTLSSSEQDLVPASNWTLPDLRNRFILGANIVNAEGVAGVAVGNGNINTAAGAPGPKGVGGENQHTLVTAEMPAHVHSTFTGNPGTGLTGGTAGTGGNTGSTGGDGPHENRPRYYGMVYIMKVKY